MEDQYIFKYMNDQLESNVVISTRVISNSSTNIFPLEHFTKDNVKIVIGNESATNTIFTTFDQISDQWRLLKVSQKREIFLIEAIRNFLRKENVNDLNNAFNNDEVSEEDYESELDSNENKYVLTIKNIKSPEDSLIIADLVDKIGYDVKELSTSDVSEMFSVNETQLINHIKQLNKYIINYEAR